MSMNIVVLAGGLSPERDVSLSSGSVICQSLINSGHNAILLDLFLGYTGKIESMEEVFLNIKTELYIVPEIPPSIDSVKKIRKLSSDGIFGENVLNLCRFADVVFMALHGDDGENGKVQAAFELLHIRYTGSNFMPCALAMDKNISKNIMREAGVLTPVSHVVSKKQHEQSKEIKIDEFPMVVKPMNGGSSIGVSITHDIKECNEAIQEALKYDVEVLVEKYIKGREFSVGILNGKALPIIEIIPKAGFYDYENKYQANRTTEICPANLSKDETVFLQNKALQVHNILKLGDYSRVDFIRNDDGEFFCLEANTLPGMTPTSLLPQEAKAAGFSFEELCNEIIRLGYERCSYH